MISARVKAGLAIALMVGAFAGGNAMKPTRHMADERPRLTLETTFPRSFGDWELDTRTPAQLIAPDLQAFLDKIYNQTLSRTYVHQRSGQRVMLSVAYGGDQTDATRAHRPEVCYPAQGFEIRADQSGSTRAGDRDLRVRRLVARQGGRVEPITYWLIVGDVIALTGTEQKLAQLRYATQGLIAEGMLVRVSTIDGDPKRAYATQDDFIAQMVLALSPDLVNRIVGVPVATGV